MRYLLPLLASLASLVAVPAAGAQGNRSAIVDSARALIDDFNERQSIGLLRRALNPALGAPDASWARGVQLLGQTLLQTNQRDEAVAWLRWALRLSPSLRVDSVNFTPVLVRAFQEARVFVASNKPEPRVSVRFEWATATTSGGFGDLRVARREGSGLTPLQLSANGEFLDEGQARRLAPGSYRIAARASGLADAEFTAEVLPGVTTQVSVAVATVALVPATADSVVPPPVIVAPSPVAVAPPKVDSIVPPLVITRVAGKTKESTAPPNAVKAPKSRRKMYSIAGGVVVGGIVAALAMPKGSKPTTGTIVITLPR